MSSIKWYSWFNCLLIFVSFMVSWKIWVIIAMWKIPALSFPVFNIKDRIMISFYRCILTPKIILTQSQLKKWSKSQFFKKIMAFLNLITVNCVASHWPYMGIPQNICLQLNIPTHRCQMWFTFSVFIVLSAKLLTFCSIIW